MDYEYSVAGNDLDVSKIISLRKRKLICQVKINEITDIVCDLECDNQEYFQMYQNYEISPEEYEEKTDEISEKLEALDKAYDALKALL